MTMSSFQILVGSLGYLLCCWQYSFSLACLLTVTATFLFYSNLLVAYCYLTHPLFPICDLLLRGTFPSCLLITMVVYYTSVVCFFTYRSMAIMSNL